jgi:hypothetical protein
MDSYSVILKNHDEKRLKITAFLKNYYSLDDEEVLAFLKNSPGFLIENKTIEKAEEVYKKAQEQNLQTLIIDDKNIPQLPTPISFMETEIKTSGFFYINKSLKEYVDFEDINMITTGIINTDIPETSTEDLSLELHKKTAKLLNLEKTKDSISDTKLKEKELIFYMDIFLNKEPLRLRLTHPNFDYSFLGKEKLYSSIENFKLLLDAITTGAPKALKNKTTDIILKKEPLSNFIYDSPDAYEKEILWLHIINPNL